MSICESLGRRSWRILCYHGVADRDRESFKRQAQAFNEMGLTFVTFEEGLKLLDDANTVGRPIMTMTFDDGGRNIYENAMPVLEEMHVRAFLYVAADYIRKGTTYRDEHPLPAMTWQQLREWLRAGHGIGSHTLTHAPLRLCSSLRLYQECVESKRVLEDNLQVPIRHLSYPWGQYSKQTCRLIRASALFDSAATIERGWMHPGQDLYRLRRDACDPCMSIRSILRIMKAADRFYWLRHFRRKPIGYWERHPEEKWESLEEITE